MPGTPISDREVGKVVALKEGGQSFRSIAKLLGRNSRTVAQAYKRLKIESPDEATIAADLRLTTFTPLAVEVVGETILQSADKRLSYEASRDLLRGRRLYTESVDVKDIGNRPTNDLIQLLNDVLTSIKSNSAIESIETEFSVVSSEIDQTKNLPESPQKDSNE